MPKIYSVTTISFALVQYPLVSCTVLFLQKRAQVNTIRQVLHGRSCRLKDRIFDEDWCFAPERDGNPIAWAAVEMFFMAGIAKDKICIIYPVLDAVNLQAF